MTKFIQERALLVSLSISSWTASKKDNKASTAVKQQHGAAAKAGWYNKRLIDPSSLLAIGQIEGRARDYHYMMTLPWGNNGERLLSGEAFFDYTSKMNEFSQAFTDEVKKFVIAYPQLVQDARQMLGTMYEPGDYPAPSDIRHRFDIKTVFTPIPDVADFRVDIGDAAIEEIRKGLTEAVNDRMKSATRECWMRLDEAVGAMAEKLIVPDAVFRDSLVDNLRVLCELLPKLNITKDQNLEIVIDNVRTLLLVEPAYLRRNKMTRAATAYAAEEIRKDIAPWIKQEPS